MSRRTTRAMIAFVIRTRNRPFAQARDLFLSLLCVHRHLDQGKRPTRLNARHGLRYDIDVAVPRRFELVIAGCCIGLAILPSCGGDLSKGGPIFCAPGQQIMCACSGTLLGVQTCNTDGSGYEPCQCTGGGAPDASVDVSVSNGGAAGVTGSGVGGTGGVGGAPSTGGLAGGAGSGLAGTTGGGKVDGAAGAKGGGGGVADASSGAAGASGGAAGTSGGAGGATGGSGGTSGASGGTNGEAGSSDAAVMDADIISCADASVGPAGAINCGRFTCYVTPGSEMHCCTSQGGNCVDSLQCVQLAPYAFQYCDGPEDCSPGTCRLLANPLSSPPSIRCGGTVPTDRLDALMNPVVCHADCDCPSVVPYCYREILPLATGVNYGQGEVIFFGGYCTAPCTTAQDCPIFNIMRSPVCRGTPSVCVY